MQKRLGLGLVALVLVLAGAVAGAGASGPVHSKVTVHLPPQGNSTYLYGLVKSSVPACRKRSMRVERSVDGSAPYQPYPGASGSNADGTWSFYPQGGIVINGYYRAIAAKKSHRGKICAVAQSKPLFVD